MAVPQDRQQPWLRLVVREPLRSGPPHGERAPAHAREEERLPPRRWLPLRVRPGGAPEAHGFFRRAPARRPGHDGNSGGCRRELRLAHQRTRQSARPGAGVGGSGSHWSAGRCCPGAGCCGSDAGCCGSRCRLLLRRRRLLLRCRLLRRRRLLLRHRPLPRRRPRRRVDGADEGARTTRTPTRCRRWRRWRWTRCRSWCPRARWPRERARHPAA